MSLSHLVWLPVLISSCSVLAFGMGCHFLALIPPFTSVNPLVNRLLQSPSRTNNWEICTRIAGSTTTLRVIYRKCTSLKTGWAHRINIRLWISEENFHRELSRIIWYTLSFNYCYRYEINLAWIMYTANSSILHRKEKKNWPDTGHLTSILSECFWPLLFQTNWISRRINEFSDNLTSLSIFTSNIKQFLWKYHIIPTLFWTPLVLLHSKWRKYWPSKVYSPEQNSALCNCFSRCKPVKTCILKLK